ncbi:MAG: DUF2125 domain-containing protein [Caulobacterales bacterium]|nr:DUF2125 domain-containing protein [Caulobacterales bacterium]
MPDPSAPRKPRRLGIVIPFGLLLIFMAGWSVVWLRARAEVVRRLDAGQAALQQAGYDISWREREVGGYPFRLDVTLTDAHVRDRSGWALEAPTVEAEAFLHAPTHWIVAAPTGLTFVRPVGGPVRVTGRLIRMSLSHFQNWPPNLSFEGTGLQFAAAPGATPFGLSAADRVEFHLRQAPAAVGDEGGAWLSVTNGKAQLTGLLGRIAGDKPISVAWDGRLSKMSAFRGRSWVQAVRNWTAAGGRMSVKSGGLTAGDALIGVNSGDLGVDREGRLAGVLDVSLRQAPRALGEMGASGTLPPDRAEAAAEVARAREAGGDLAHATLNFEAGRTTLGPVALSAAPKVY